MKRRESELTDIAEQLLDVSGIHWEEGKAGLDLIGFAKLGGEKKLIS